MKQLLLIACVFIYNITIGQEIFYFEKKIDSIENYNAIEVNFKDLKQNIQLSGTLITPKSNYTKIVIIAPGSGKDTRNSHYILAQEFLKNGIAVYRYDDRGVGKSKGKHKRNIKQNISDLYYAFKNLRQTDTLSLKTIGILGHSKGGFACINAFQKGLKIDFLILMSSPIEKNGVFLKYKFKSENGKISFKEVYKNLNIPTLFITGSNDSVVDSKNTYSLLKKLNNQKIEIQILNNLNHYLRIGTDNFLKNKNYNSIYEIDNTALNNIINWTNKII